MGFVRLMFLGLIACTAAYLLISVYSRSVRREKLEKRWAAEHPEGGDPEARDAYIETGMTEYHRGFRKKLIWLVYVVPLIALLVVQYLVNFD
ncbi:hypothetical protein [Seohaeicola zhoushanensis]|uniref:Uncharacterized protein n=1 Tax=Seohaeicola zhoushanensis TaxID=1569283 RepID=A0A8J3GVP4_9RHOB|nr:hypothetical protein [Seohaeicola zhoushanensis]GHF40393.1 hypothetical protein GCM10017056_09930 [Seohaeicola zhoushanensis]